MATPTNLTIYGFPEECKKFDERHPLWNEMMGNLVAALTYLCASAASLQIKSAHRVHRTHDSVG
jgi:hypothetical protein